MTVFLFQQSAPPLIFSNSFCSLVHENIQETFPGMNKLKHGPETVFLSNPLLGNPLL